MTVSDIVNIRFSNQHIGGTILGTPRDVAEWMGAMQAQDYQMSKWAFGIRLPGSDTKSIEEAADRGEILRTHLLRPTWHFVAARNIKWLIGISAASIRSSLLSRHRQLKIDDRKIGRSLDLLGNVLKGGNHLTREEITNLFREEGISAESTTTYHMILWAEIEGLVCSGRRKGKELSYALVDERAPESEKLSREEAVLKLVKIYFSSHGPATLRDFTWWSGLGTVEARQAISNSSLPGKFEFEGSMYWMGPVSQPEIKPTVFLLPAYDEYLISYSNRSAVLPARLNTRAVSSNGIFRPLVLINGKVAGLWKRSTAGNGMRIEIDLFRDPGVRSKRLIQKAAEEYSEFSGKKPDIRFS